MTIHQVFLGLGAKGESYWIKSLRFDFNANIDMRGNGSGTCIMSPDGTDDGNLYTCSGQQSQSYPNNKDGVHMIKFDKDGTVSLKKSFFTDMGYHQYHTGLDSNENLYIGLQQGRIMKFNSSFVEQVRLDIGKTSWEQSRPFIFEGDYIHMSSYDNGYDNSTKGRSYYRKLSKTNLAPVDFGSTSYNTKGMWKQGDIGPWALKDSKFYWLQHGVTVDGSSYHDVTCKFDYTSSSWNDSAYPFHFSDDLDWVRRLSKQDGSTGHTLSTNTACMTVDDDGNVYTAGKNAQVGNTNPDYGSRNQVSKINSSGTTQWFMNIARSADGDGTYSWGGSYSQGGGPIDMKVIGNFVYTINQGKNNTQTNKSGNVKDITIAKMNKSDGAYQSSYSIANETRNFMESYKSICGVGALWTDTAVYFTLNGQYSQNNQYEGDRTYILKLPIDGGVNGSYTLDGHTIKISDNSLSQGSTSTSGKTWTSSGSNLGDSRNGRSDESTSSAPAVTTHTASYTDTQLDL